MEDLNTLISQLTLEEKATLCIGATPWLTAAVERLGIPALIMSDGPHGLRRVSDEGMNEASKPATCFPTASCTASSWDVDLIRQLGDVLADECFALNVNVLLGPGANMKRSPLCGRNFEYFSEDPFLAGEMAANYIVGLQNRGIGASLKHFAANNQEFQRFSIDAVVDERALREIYLPAFEKAVKVGKPWTVMHSYNKLNGQVMSENAYLLKDILKGEWGFEGLVESDWGAVRDRVKSLVGGTDLEMPGPKPARAQAVVDAVQAGELDEAILDEAVRRVLRVVFMARQTSKTAAGFDVDAHHAFAARLAAEGMVLLKNDGILPLEGQNKLAVIGRSALRPHFQGGGSSHINPTKVSVPLDEIKARAGGAEVLFAEGYPEDDSARQDLIDEAVVLAARADCALLFIALPTWKESEGYDRKDLDLTAQQIALIKAVTAAQPRSVVVLNNGSAVVMRDWIDGAAAVLECWMMGQAGGIAIADILFGKVNPSGKLAETFPRRLEDTPAFLNWPGELGSVRYDEGLYIGYRWYDSRDIPVQFPFGYGLSYTSFAYANARVPKEAITDVEGTVVSVDITNTGKRAGKEVVQVYVRDVESKLARPAKELKGFAKVDLLPGETKTVSIPLDFRAFAFYHPKHKQWLVESGDFEILVGASSQDIRQVVALSVETTAELPSLLDRESTIREWMEDPRGSDVFAEFFAQMMEKTAAVFGGMEEGEGMGMNTMDMFMDTPVLSVLNFMDALLPASPDEIVDGLLAKAHSL